MARPTCIPGNGDDGPTGEVRGMWVKPRAPSWPPGASEPRIPASAGPPSSETSPLHRPLRLSPAQAAPLRGVRVRAWRTLEHFQLGLHADQEKAGESGQNERSPAHQSWGGGTGGSIICCCGSSSRGQLSVLTQVGGRAAWPRGRRPDREKFHDRQARFLSLLAKALPDNAGAQSPSGRAVVRGSFFQGWISDRERCEGAAGGHRPGPCTWVPPAALGPPNPGLAEAASGGYLFPRPLPRQG